MPLTKLNNKAVANVTSMPVSLGDMVLVSSATASSSASIEFTLGNYKEYQFYFVDIHPSVDATHLGFQTSTDNGSTYGVTTTSTLFRSYHFENDSGAGVLYRADYDLAQSTNFIPIADGISTGADNDQSVSGIINLYNPSSSTYVKHFICNANECHQVDISINVFVSGYFNTTSPLTNIKFQMSSGNIDAGTILMYGIN